MQVVEAVRMISVMFLIVAAALSGCTGGRGAGTSSPPPPAPSPTTVVQATTTTRATKSPGPTTSPAASRTVATTATAPAETAPPGCAGLNIPALVLVPPPGRDTDARRFMVIDPGGEEQCSLGAPYVPWAATVCQVVGERVLCWDDEENALQVLDVLSGALEHVDPALENEDPQLDFLASPDGEKIVWSLTDLDISRADVPEGTSRCTLSVSQADGGDMRLVLEEQYNHLYHLAPLTWTPDGEAIFFARIRIWTESGGAFIPTFSGRYSELFRLDLLSNEFRKVFPLDDAAACNRCISDVSPDGRWLAYHREDGSVVLRDLVDGEEMLVADASFACYLGRAHFGPGGEHLVYTELEGPCGQRDTFDVARAVMADVPFERQSRVLAESTEAVDWAVGWLDRKTPIFDRVYKEFDERGLWVARHPGAGQPSAADDLLSGTLIGVLRPPDPDAADRPG